MSSQFTHTYPITQPLSSFLNLPRLLQTPHTPAQISALWTAYHASRSQGTGRGYICATVPLEAYEKMMGVAKRYPAFIVPVPRQAPLEEGEVEKKAYEFYYLQWAFHEVPEVPTYERLTDPFAALIPPSPSTSPHNPQTSTVLFTPLLEYKLRQTFATPYLVLTHYTDLAQTHGVVLLRGEITPSAASGSGGGGEGWMLSQQDAQLLAVGVQRFYLWGGGGKEEGLLKKFHESPAEFSWEDLLELGDPTAI
ncbi:hypothetical protein JAAARDRAFT_37936 [Jaapia argillacea MUCL 33604]|uniref:ATP11-domain-containing protein n=1 Tax=Jaapia argillacea MUCL 33604 TaxID=933084 RepID=A0A067PIU3_9AGAM|nr:hypothetical protein JAAARDRAFT_37936 [Jaapia argillacea MUCL 33604]